MLNSITVIFGVVGILLIIFLEENNKLYCIVPFAFSVLSFIAGLPDETSENVTTQTPYYENTEAQTSSTETSSEYYETVNTDAQYVPSSGTITIEDNYITGSINYEEQEIIYEYIAPKTGQYRFDFDSSNVNNPFLFSIYDASGTPIKSEYSSSNGTTVDLTENEVYTIYVQESYGILEYYSIFINVPTDTIIVTDNLISGSITYTDQVNYYTYTAPRTGTYRFDFDYSDVNNPFYFYISDSRKEKLAKISASENGKTLDLIENETYTICIEEHNGLLDSYSISIGVPNLPIKIDTKEFSGTLHYTDQCDIYYYTAPRTGTYRFDFDFSDANNPFFFYVYDSKKAKLTKVSSSEEGKTLDLKKGENYTIYVEEHEGLLNSYTVKIGVPKKTKNINSFPFSGKITYINQCNKYKFKASYSGEYIFELGINNSTYTYKFTITNSKKEVLNKTFSYDTLAKVELIENETYTITIEQIDGFPIEYNIKQQ